MARLIRKTAKVSGSGGGKINVRGREWTKEDLRELKNHVLSFQSKAQGAARSHLDSEHFRSDPRT
jgi:hypothetical protein